MDSQNIGASLFGEAFCVLGTGGLAGGEGVGRVREAFVRNANEDGH